MKILAHRGYWKKPDDKNSSVAIREALKRGYGFESDIRDFDGKIVISHDIPTADSPDAKQVFRWLREYGDRYTFAINIKSDGLKNLLKEALKAYQITNYFLFDMSVPQMVEFNDMGLRFYTRQSEMEQVPCMYKEANGVWIDGFYSTDWITKELLEKHLDNHKEIILVSPELHGNKEYKFFWDRIREYGLTKLGICTDQPDEAREFFYE